MSPDPRLSALIGIPFVDGGRDPKRDGGVDCWGLTILAARVLGITLPDWPGVSCDASGEVGAIMGTEAADEARWMRLDAPEPGAVALFATSPEYPRLMTHAGCCIGGQYFLHTMRRHSSVAARLDNSRWKNALRGLWRWVG
jgi:cell wall-associated NlpC family hydrolase